MQSSFIFLRYYFNLKDQGKKYWHEIRAKQFLPLYFGVFLRESLHLSDDQISELSRLSSINGFSDDFSSIALPTEYILFDHYFSFSIKKYQEYDLQLLQIFQIFVQKLADYTGHTLPSTGPISADKQMILASDVPKPSFYFSKFWCNLI